MANINFTMQVGKTTVSDSSLRLPGEIVHFSNITVAGISRITMFNKVRKYSHNISIY